MQEELLRQTERDRNNIDAESLSELLERESRRYSRRLSEEEEARQQ